MELDQSWCAIALRYLTTWRRDTYDEAALLRTLSTRERNDDSSTDVVRRAIEDKATRTEDLAGRLGTVCEWLERDLADRARRKAPVRQYRFADAGSWPPGLDHPDDPDSAA